MDLVPGVFNEGDGDIAEGWRELGANPSSSDLFVSVIASPENAGVECISDDSGDVGGLDGALCIGCFWWCLPMWEWWKGLPVA